MLCRVCFFQDGGLVVMGANILNMGLVTAAVGYGLYRSASTQSTTVNSAWLVWLHSFQ
ncbi:MAG: energy-coupling factor ABC transporter permease [Anaerolineales bacterium]|nr:energy-coupling factor ABC transporter permease [Anaerolineales bacterium]